MVNSGLKKGLTGILTIVLIGSGVGPFVAANGLGSSFWLTFYLIVITGITLLNLKWFIELPLQLIGLLFTCHRYFPSNQSFSFSWVKGFLLTSLDYLDPVQRAEYRFLPANIALIFIALFIGMLVKLIISYELWMLPFFAVLCYLLILTVFNGTDHFASILRLLITGFILSSWLSQESEGWQFSKGQGLSVLALISCLALAWQLPIWLPQMHQSIQMKSQPLRATLRSKSFYQMIEFARGNGQSATTGFSENDSVLGGAVIPNDEIVFLAKQKTAHYWKVENKDRYSGRGWENSETTREVMTQETLVIGEGHSRYQESGSPIELTLPNPLRYVPKPQGMLSWDLPASYRINQGLEYSAESNRFYVNLSPESPAESLITYQYFPPDYTTADLEASPFGDGLEENARYLQLPDKLPERVAELAQQITAGSSTGYQQVKAIESYLKNTVDFRYSLEEAEVVPANQDYVDFFLFESKIGYCEHFSSSMVVLARTLGIPARWAKGFSEGRVTQTNEDGTKTYTITNQNAHAWPEIYFQGVGWVPFEPTKSFISSEQVALTTPNQPDSTETSVSSAPVPFSQSSEERSQSSSTGTSQQAAAKEEATKRLEKNSQFKKKAQAFLIFILSLALIGAVIFRSWLMIGWWLLKVNYLPNYSFVKAYDGLVTLLARERRRPASETIRQYQERLTQEYPDHAETFKQLTDKYEGMIYRESGTVPDLREKERKMFSSMVPLVRLLKEKPGKAD